MVETLTTIDGAGSNLSGWWKHPDAIDDTDTTNEDSPVYIPVLANDKNATGVYKIYDIDATYVYDAYETYDSYTTDSFVSADHVQLVDNPVTLASGAKVTLMPDGKTVEYNPNHQFEHLNNGETALDSFAYAVYGRYGVDRARVDVTVTGVNDGDPGTNHSPVANNDTAYLRDYYPYPLPYAEGTDSTNATDGSVSDAPIITTLAIGEEGDPYPYPSSVKINVLANDKDEDNDPLHVATIAGTKVDTDPNTTDVPDSVYLENSGALVTLNADGSLTYSEGIIVYSDTDPAQLTEQAVTLSVNSDGSSALVPIDPILPPEPLPYPGPWLVDSFTYSAADDKQAESNAATVTVYRAFYDYILGTEPVADASTTAAPGEPNDLLLA